MHFASVFRPGLRVYGVANSVIGLKRLQMGQRERKRTDSAFAKGELCVSVSFRAARSSFGVPYACEGFYCSFPTRFLECKRFTARFGACFRGPLTLRGGNWGPEKGESRFSHDFRSRERCVLRG